MKNYKQEKCKENRNYVKYLESDNFIEPPAYTIENLLKNNRAFIKNKRETIDGETTKIMFEFKLANSPGYISVTVSKDHLINLKVLYKKTKEIKTRDMSEAVSLIREVLFT